MQTEKAIPTIALPTFQTWNKQVEFICTITSIT